MILQFCSRCNHATPNQLLEVMRELDPETHSPEQPLKISGQAVFHAPGCGPRPLTYLTERICQHCISPEEMDCLPGESQEWLRRDETWSHPIGARPAGDSSSDEKSEDEWEAF